MSHNINKLIIMSHAINKSIIMSRCSNNRLQKWSLSQLTKSKPLCNNSQRKKFPINSIKLSHMMKKFQLLN